MCERKPIIIYSTGKSKPVGILVSGIRLSGKDTFSDSLRKNLETHDIRLSVRSTALQLKHQFCEEQGLDLSKFLTSREYKEIHRPDFADWVLRQPEEESFRMFRESLRNDLLLMQVIIINDLRNPKDYERFSFIFPAFLSVRITASDETRKARGYTPGDYDTSVFETAIHEIPVDITIQNDGNLEELETEAQALSDALITFIIS